MEDPQRHRITAVTWRDRALNAEEAIKTAHTEILTQRTRIGELLGQIRPVNESSAVTPPAPPEPG